MPRSLLLLLLFIFCLTPLAGVAWLTHHPEAEILAEARNWPIVGPVASWFRDQYLPPVERGENRPHFEGTSPAGGGHFTAVDGVTDGTTQFPSVSVGPRIWLLPNTLLRREPSASAPVIRHVQSISSAAQLERLGKWYRVRQGAAEGWVYLENYDPNRDPPYGEAPEPPRPVPSLPPDPELLKQARRFLGERERKEKLGPFQLYTNLSDSALLDYLHTVALQVEPTYITRYDRQPVGSSKEAVVLYESEIPYRLLESRSPRLTGLHSSGFNASGLVVFYVGGRHRAEVSATLIHEAVHLLNRRALGPALPPWLDEGLADDLGHLRVAEDGTLDVEALSDTQLRSSGQIKTFGGVTSLAILEQARQEGRLLPLAHLTSLDWDEFVHSDRINLHYALSSFFVHFLLKGEEGRFSALFKAFLDDVAEGKPATGEAVKERLGMEWGELDARFEHWLEKFAQEAHS